MVLDITEEQAVLTLLIDVVAHALCMVEFSLREVSFHVSDATCANLLNELIVGCVENQEPIVRRVCHN